MKCLCCEQPIKIVTAGDDSRGSLPNIVGGHISIRLGFGSCIHDCMGHPMQKHQSAICDDCWESKKHLVRTVQLFETRRFVEVQPIDDSTEQVPANHSQECGANARYGVTGECTCTNSMPNTGSFTVEAKR